MYARQRAQLTGPNRPNGSHDPAVVPTAQRPHALHSSDPRPPQHTTQGRQHGPHATHGPQTTVMPAHHRTPLNTAHAKRTHAPEPQRAPERAPTDCVRRPGGHGGGTPPDPIPNSDVKTTSAYDTVPQGTGKSVAARSPDAINTTHRRVKDDAQGSKTEHRRRPATIHRRGSKTVHGRGSKTVHGRGSKTVHGGRGVEQPGSSSGS